MNVGQLKSLLNAVGDEEEVCIEGFNCDLEIQGITWDRDDGILILIPDTDMYGDDGTGDIDEEDEDFMYPDDIPFDKRTESVGADSKVLKA